MEYTLNTGIDKNNQTKVEDEEDSDEMWVGVDSIESELLENDILRTRLARLKHQRKLLRKIHRQRDEILTTLQEQVNQANLEQEQALLEYQSAVSQHRRAAHLLHLSQQWNVVSDCFHIGHRGPFGTINGLRLGAVAEGIPRGEDQPTPTRRPFALGGMESTTATSGTGSTGASAIRVPWMEINAALGHVALLLSTLEGQPHAGITLRHQIVPMGSFSKIGIRRGDSVSLYSLYSDDGFQFFGKRNFNTALQSLVECVADAAEAIQKRDRTIAVPHAMEKHPEGMTVGGLSVNYGANGIEWTRAMKYLLTNLKHLLTCRALCIWDG